MAENHDDFELIELEYTEDDIAYYIEDEDGNELGFAIVDENGEEVEYYYDGKIDESKTGSFTATFEDQISTYAGKNITGYKFEPWHYRYVGVDAATFIYENDLTFEEYYAYYVKK